MAGDRISELYWGDAGPAFSTRAADEARERIDWICSNTVGDRVLDAGCSQGIAALLLARQGKHVVGVDVDPDAIAFARGMKNAEPPEIQERLKFVEGELGAAVGSEFSTAIAGEVVEHLESPGILLRKMWELLIPGGTAIVTTPFALTSHHDHHHIFFLDNFLSIVTPFFEMQELSVRKKKILFVGTRKESITAATSVEIEDILTRTADAIIEMERNYYLPRLLDLKKRVKQLERWKAKYEAEMK